MRFRIIVILILLCASVWTLAPREPASLDIAFDEAVLGDDGLHLFVPGQHHDLHVDGRPLDGAHATVQRVQLADGQLREQAQKFD